MCNDFSAPLRWNAAFSEALSTRRTIAGDMAVVWNEREEDSQLNIELLFNATSANRDAIRAIFNK